MEKQRSKVLNLDAKIIVKKEVITSKIYNRIHYNL